MKDTIEIQSGPASRKAPYTVPTWHRQTTRSMIEYYAPYRGFDMYVNTERKTEFHWFVKDQNSNIRKGTIPKRSGWTVAKVKQHCIDQVDSLLGSIL